MFTVRVEARVEDLERELRDVARSQLPFTMAQTLTKVAELARDRVRAEMPRRFTIRSQRVIRGVTIQPAKKRDWPRPFAIVGTLDAFMARQFLGGIKRAEKPSPGKGAPRIAVPTSYVAARRTKTGKVPKRLKPRTILSKKGGRVTPGDGGLILKSTGGRRRKKSTRTLYTLHRRIRIPQRMDFVEVVETEARQSFERVFRRRLRANIASAR